MHDFMIRAGLAGLGVALAAGPLGCFVIWRRMAYFGDAMAHAAILGVALALLLDTPIALGTLVMAALVGAGVARLAGRGMTTDATLGVVAHGALAVGLMVFYMGSGPRVGLESFLFGDILLVKWGELVGIWAGVALILGLLAWRWQRLLTATLNEELARSAGVDPARERLVLTLAIAVTVAVALKVVGALLIGAMLIIPAAAAQRLARSPEAMALLGSVIGAVSALTGLWLSYVLDVPAGPSIVTVALAIYLIALLRR